MEKIIGEKKKLGQQGKNIQKETKEKKKKKKKRQQQRSNGTREGVCAAARQPVGSPWGAREVPSHRTRLCPLGRAQGRGGCARAKAEPSFPRLDMRAGIQVIRHPPREGSGNLGSPQCPRGVPQHGAWICPTQQWLC